MEKKPFRLAGVVLNYGTAESTLLCVERLLKEPAVDNVYVVDNDSPDDSRELLRNGLQGEVFDGRVTVVHAETNEGYGPGNNLGLRRALRDGHTAALVANPDVLVEPGSVALMTRSLIPPVAVVSLTLWNDDAETELECIGGAFYSRFTSGSRAAVTMEEALRADRFCGACFLVDLTILEEVGWLPDQYFLYYEELDLVRRLDNLGYKWTVAEGAVAVHRRGESVGSSADLSHQSLLSAYYGTRSALVYTRLWERRFALVVTALRTARGVGILAGSPAHGRAILRAVASAWSPSTSRQLRALRQTKWTQSTR